MRGRIAAIFDVDGTLVAGRSLERIFIGRLLREGELGAVDLARLLGGAFGKAALRANKSYLRGKSCERLSALARRCFEDEIKPLLLPAALERMRWHKAAGHEVALLSGTLELLMAPLAEHLGVCITSSTRLEVADGQLSGKIIGSHPFGPGKVERLGEMARRHSFDLNLSFAYADHYADRHLLESVGRPVAANPDRRLRMLAESRGWMIEDFSSGKTRRNLEMSGIGQIGGAEL